MPGHLNVIPTSKLLSGLQINTKKMETLPQKLNIELKTTADSNESPEKRPEKILGTQIEEKLASLSDDLLEKYRSLPPRLKSIFQGKSTVRSIEEIGTRRFHPILGEVRIINTAEELRELMEAEARTERYSQEQYDEEDVESMDSKEIEYRAEFLLHTLLNKIGLRNDFFQNDKKGLRDKFKQFMEISWSNRQQSGKLEYFDEEKMINIKEEINELENERKNLLKEKARWQAKKNRPTKHKLAEVNKKLAAFYDSTTYWGDKTKQLRTLNDKLEKLKSLQKKQESLNHLLKRLDSLTYTVIISQSLDSVTRYRSDRFSEDKKKDLKEKMRALRNYIEEFSKKHEGENALIKPLSEDRINTINKLAKRMRVLLGRVRLANESDRDKSGETATVKRELDIIFTLLNKHSE